MLRKTLKISKTLKRTVAPNLNKPSKYNVSDIDIDTNFTLNSFAKQLGVKPSGQNINVLGTKTVNADQVDKFNESLLKKTNTTLQPVPLKPDSMRIGLIGKKVGMTSIFDKWGKRIPLTVIKIDNNQVVSIKKLNENSFHIEVGAGYDPKATLPMKGHFYKNGIPPKEKVKAFKTTSECVLPIGYLLTTRHFKVGQYVDVQSLSKGKATEGVMTRWGFKGGVKTHGNSLKHRSIGSIGNREFPARVWPGKKMDGKTGNELITVMSQKIYKSDYTKGLLFIRGAVPGQIDGWIFLRDARRRMNTQFTMVHSPTFIPVKGTKYLSIEEYQDKNDPFEKYEHDNNERLGISDEEEEGPIHAEDEQEI